MAKYDYSFLFRDHLPVDDLIKLSNLLYDGDTEACVVYVVCLRSELQLVAVQAALHKLELFERYHDEPKFLQLYLTKSPAVQCNALLKVHVQFLLAKSFCEVQYLQEARKVYDGIRLVLEEESPLNEKEVILLRLKLHRLLLNIDEGVDKRNNALQEIPEKQYRDMWEELKYWISNEEETERTDFEIYYLYLSLRTWIKIVLHVYRRNPNFDNLLDFIRWVRLTRTIAPSQVSRHELLGLQVMMMHELHCYQGEEPIDEIQEYLQNF